MKDIVCPNQDVTYTCYSEHRVQWISPSATSYYGLNPNVIIGNLEIITSSNSSATTSGLIIRYSPNITATNVTCTSGEQEMATSTYLQAPGKYAFIYILVGLYCKTQKHN